MRTIGEVASALRIRQHVLRYWEQQFPMLRPLKRGGGRRLYRPDDVALVAEIDRLINQQGYTLKGARQAIEKEARRPRVDASDASMDDEAAAGGSASRSANASANRDAGQDEVLTRLRALRERLAAALGT